MKAIVIGATGATGKDLIKVLLENPAYTEIKSFVRRPAKILHPKLEEVLTDFENLTMISDKIQGNVLFSCLGTTRTNAGSVEKQWHIDYEVPAQFAEIAKRNGVSSVVLLSAYNASPESKVPYSKMKGKLEEHLAKLTFNKLIIFRPGFLLRKDSDRVGESLVANTLQILSKIGIMKAFKPLPTQLLAEKMAKAPVELSEGKHIIELNKIFTF